MTIHPKEAEQQPTRVGACSERYQALNGSIRDFKRAIWRGIGIAMA